MNLKNKSWIGNELFEVTKRYNFKNEEYVNFVASVSRPKVKMLSFGLPARCLDDMMEELSNGEILMKESSLDGYEIIEKNNRVQEIYMNEQLVYSRIRNGF